MNDNPPALTPNEREQVLQILDLLLSVLDASGEMLAAAHLCQARHQIINPK